MNNNQHVKAVEIEDIRGKKQKYLVIGNNEDHTKNVVINVGEKTFNAVKELTEGKPETTKPKGGK